MELLKATTDTSGNYRKASVQFSHSVVSNSLRPMDCSMPGFPVHHQLLEFIQTHSIESVMPSNHLILCHPLFLLPSIFPSIRVFSNESVLCIRWSKYWSFKFNISPSNENPELISIRMDWLDILEVQGILKRFSNTTVQKHQFLCAQAKAPHYSTLAWKIPWMEEPGRLQSMGSLRVGHH